MDPELHELLIGAQTTAIGAFHAAFEGSIYADWIDIRTNPEGYMKDFTAAKGSGFLKFKGEADATELVYRGYQILTVLYTQGVKIPKLEWQQLLAWLGANFPGLLSDVMADAGAAMDEAITALIKSAIDPTATNANLFHDSKFFGKYDLPASGALAPAKMNNLVKAKTRDADGVRNAYYEAKALISTMKRPNGKVFHTAGVYRSGFDLMFATKDEKIVNAVFDTGKTTSRDAVDKIAGVSVSENNVWDAEEMDLMLLRPTGARGMSGFQVIKKEENPVMASNIPPAPPNGYEEASVQALQAYRATATLNLEAGFGSPYDLVAILLPAR